jgi:hypothetical protein
MLSINLDLLTNATVVNDANKFVIIQKKELNLYSTNNNNRK